MSAINNMNGDSMLIINFTKNIIKLSSIGIIFVWVIGVPVFGEALEVVYHNHFVSQFNSNPGKSTDVLVSLYSFFGTGKDFEDGSVLSELLDTSSTDDLPAMTKAPLFYPNPFKFETGSTLGYRLNKNMNILIRIFDAQSNQILKRSIESGDLNGGVVGYNYVPFTSADFNGHSLPAGVYFYVIESDGDYLAKGKFAVLP
jgi:hypothetical protein